MEIRLTSSFTISPTNGAAAVYTTDKITNIRPTKIGSALRLFRSMCSPSEGMLKSMEADVIMINKQVTKKAGILQDSNEKCYIFKQSLGVEVNFSSFTTHTNTA